MDPLSIITKSSAPSRIHRFLLSDNLFAITPPRELVGCEHFIGTDLESRNFSFYSECHQLTENIDWDHNPGTSHWGHDLNRFGYLVLSATVPTAHIHIMEQLILDWIDKNDRKTYNYTRYAWGNLLNVSIRIENWWRFLAERWQDPDCSLSASDRARIKTSVYRQLMILLHLVRKRGYKDNWSVISLRSAIYILYSSPDFPFRERLIRIVWEGIYRAADIQVLPDGALQELSPHYHWVAMELLTSCRELAEEAGTSDADRLAPIISTMYEFCDALMLPDGGIVSLGDSDLDYGPRIGEFLNKLRRSTPVSPARELNIFPYAGVAVLRDQQRGHLLAFDAGPFGTAHQHEDALSFWLTAFGEQVIVDPGRYLYDHTPDGYYAFLCSTQAHSTLTVDGFGQNARARPERWRRSDPGWPTASRVGDKVTLTGRYDDGYGDGRHDVIHERAIESQMVRGRWQIRDLLLGDRRLLVESRFQFAPCSWSLNDRTFVSKHGRVRSVLKFGDQWSASVVEGATSPKGGWFSPGLNRLEAAPCLILSAEVQLPAEFVVEITVARE